MIFKYSIKKDNGIESLSAEIPNIPDHLYHYIEERLRQLEKDIVAHEIKRKVEYMAKGYEDAPPEFEATFQKYFKDILA
jgi:hypothetical protein